MKKKIKRKIIVNPKLQLGWAFFVAMLQLPGIVITGFAMSWFYLIYLDNNLIVSCNTRVLVVLTVLCLFLITGVIVFIARRTTTIAGPLKKLQTLMSEMARGRVPEKPITFRKGDWFSELEKDLNAISQSMNQANQVRTHTRQTLERFKEDMETGQEIQGEAYIQTIDNLIKEL
ncbi:hypothetical protein DO021_17890 [Desulfobacter hydrogenophilus]|uniref:HAMP domain-containing protein n=1 Tax=Desulfobacter hydrogenophilus TaxID=2291 RepID=A0A328FC24_9BACT|nr:hypothetical protein [Desulfobacter hydrogenophilus]NDY73619.1 hypothetical protein [Desulfobacter hydrogenophilus]QBH12112.1 hypothetical protein EYB58_03735 [Desulfobacter hydrogenophilus]RAM00663.1 hypothetical protein DO021_17890 [Desulfobacter hydrogenophilus]